MAQRCVHGVHACFAKSAELVAPPEVVDPDFTERGLQRLAVEMWMTARMRVRTHVDKLLDAMVSQQIDEFTG